MRIISRTNAHGKMPSDPQTADEFDAALNEVSQKYRDKIPLTRRELLRLAQAALRLIGGER